MTSSVPHTRNLLVLALAAAALAGCATPQSPYTGAAGTESPQTRAARECWMSAEKHPEWNLDKRYAVVDKCIAEKTKR
jgi:hypothetical protein